MSEFQSDKRWSDQFLSGIRQIIGPLLISPAPIEIDRNEGTDFVMLNAKSLKIAARVRRSSQISKWANQFTLRSSRPSGAKTEFQKVVEGLGDLCFYGWAEPNSASIRQWSLIDLDAFRAHLILNASQLKCGEVSNIDGTAFRWFDLTSFPTNPPILVASSGDEKPTYGQVIEMAR
jgi:hypothetical protein